MAKLKCVECLLQSPSGVRLAITILDGYAVCQVHLKRHVQYSMKKAEEVKKARELKEKEELEKKKVEGKKVEEKKLSNDPKGSTLDSNPTP